MDYIFTKKLQLIARLFISVLLSQVFISQSVKAGENIPVSREKKVTVSGTVTTNDGEILPGVNVLEKGTKNGTWTMANGQYTLSVDENAILVFSMVGFNTKEVSVNGQTKLDVQLTPGITSLNEVMVVGYGSKNKSTFTGSAVTLKAEDLNKSSLSVANLLQGRAAGVQVSQNNGTPGAALSIRVRGTNSINADSEPLYVIDSYTPTGI